MVAPLQPDGEKTQSESKIDTHPTEETPPATGLPSGREIVAAVALVAVGFLGTAALLHAAIRDQVRLHADFRSEKLLMMDQWRGTVFSGVFGTSHVNNGFSPAAFDETLKGSPIATRTANFAIEGGAQAEQFAMAKEFLQHLESPAQAGAPPQPCLVILELGAGANFTPDHLMSARAINIYDWPAARLITHLSNPEMPAEQRYGRTGVALVEMALHYSNVGMLSNDIFKPPLDQEKFDAETENDRRGLMLKPPFDSNQPRMQAVIRDNPGPLVITPQPIFPGNLEMVQQLAAVSAVKNVSFVYLVVPRLLDVGGTTELPDHVTVTGPWGPMEVPIMNLARPDRFPQMYDPRLWHDEAHFYPDGAKLVSQILAEQLKQWYTVHGEPKPCG